MHFFFIFSARVQMQGPMHFRQELDY
jgi:hypothetical protein